MPKEFDDMVKAIKASLKKDNPEMDPKELESRAFAIATDRFKKKTGKNPMESIGFFWTTKPTLLESGEVSGRKWLRIGGIALVPTISQNNRQYTINNIRENHNVEVSVFSEHRPVEEHVIGKVKLFEENGSLRYDGRIRNTQAHPDIVEKCQDELLKVSIGASDFTAIPQESGNVLIEDMKINHLGLVGLPGIKEVTMEYAIAESANRILKEEWEETETEKINESQKEVTTMADEKANKVLEEKDLEIKKLQEQLVNQKKEAIVERLLEVNKELNKEDLMKESEEVLKLRVGYEKKIAEQEEQSVEKSEEEKKKEEEEKKKKKEEEPQPKEGEGDGVVEPKEEPAKEGADLKGIIVTKEGVITMSEDYRNRFNNELKESIYA